MSDKSTIFRLCDVIIDEQHRGKELGKTLIKFITESEEYKNLMGILTTKDAHSLYKKYGFIKTGQERFMIKPKY